jgi:hypothetical protein
MEPDAATGVEPCNRNGRNIDMGKGLILWMLGVPGIVVIGLLLFHVI